MSATEGKVISCRAAVAWEPKKPLSIETIEVEPPKEGEVRIKILYTAICHTDLFSHSGVDGLKFPMILGHEGAGIVESVGPGVKSVAPGDHVIPAPLTQCQKCDICKNPETNVCEKNLWGSEFLQIMDDGNTRFSCKGQRVYHYIGLSTFSEFIVVREMMVAKINPKAPLDKVCLIGCAITTGYGAPINCCKVRPGEAVGVWGLGAIGLAIVMGCRDQGAKHIVAIDPSPERFEKAKVLGATEYVNPKEIPEGKSIAQYFYEKFNGGLDSAFEAAGEPEAMAQAVECTKRGVGQTCILGVSEKDFILSSGIILYGRTIRGCIVGGYKPLEGMPKLVDKYMEGKLNLEEFITYRFPLEEINKGVEHLQKIEGIRSVISVAQE